MYSFPRFLEANLLHMENLKYIFFFTFNLIRLSFLTILNITHLIICLLLFQLIKTNKKIWCNFKQTLFLN